MAAALVGVAGAGVTDRAGADDAFEAVLGAPFYKMSGSGNDFVFFDARPGGVPVSVDPSRIASICARGEGVGADGVVFFDQPDPGVIRIAYFNSDGSRAMLCGNATLCTANLAAHLGAVALDTTFSIFTDAGPLEAVVESAGGAAFTLNPIESLVPNVTDVTLAGAGGGQEQRIGYAVAGVPHLVVLVDDVDSVDLATRGPALRRARPDRPDGANVNYVSPSGQGVWQMRTFERGVEGETLACGTGAVASAAMLRAWGVAHEQVRLRTRSHRILSVDLTSSGSRPRLAGEGRLVFVGTLHR